MPDFATRRRGSGGLEVRCGLITSLATLLRPERLALHDEQNQVLQTVAFGLCIGDKAVNVWPVAGD